MDQLVEPIRLAKSNSPQSREIPRMASSEGIGLHDLPPGDVVPKGAFVTATTEGQIQERLLNMRWATRSAAVDAIKLASTKQGKRIITDRTKHGSRVCHLVCDQTQADVADQRFACDFHAVAPSKIKSKKRSMFQASVGVEEDDHGCLLATRGKLLFETQDHDTRGYVVHHSHCNKTKRSIN